MIHAQAIKVLREIASLKAYDPNANKAWAANQRGKWTTLNVPTELWSRFQHEVAALSSQCAAPDGWQLVPKVPTWDMLIAASTAYREPRDGHYTARMECARNAYEVMLSKAPSPSQCAAGEAEPVVVGITKAQAKAILDMALDLEKTGRIVSLATGQERSDFVAHNRAIQCALTDYLKNLSEDFANEPVAWRSKELYSPDVGSWYEYYDDFRTIDDKTGLTPLYASPLPVHQQKDDGGVETGEAPSQTDAQIEAVRQWFIEKHACWFTTASLRDMFAVAAGVETSGGKHG